MKGRVWHCSVKGIIFDNRKNSDNNMKRNHLFRLLFILFDTYYFEYIQIGYHKIPQGDWCILIDSQTRKRTVYSIGSITSYVKVKISLNLEIQTFIQSNTSNLLQFTYVHNLHSYFKSPCNNDHPCYLKR